MKNKIKRLISLMLVISIMLSMTYLSGCDKMGQTIEVNQGVFEKNNFLEKDILSENGMYFVSYPGPYLKETTGYALCDGKTVKEDAKADFLTVYYDTDPNLKDFVEDHFYIDMAINNSGKISGAMISFISNYNRPQKVEFFGSLDGNTYEFIAEGVNPKDEEFVFGANFEEVEYKSIKAVVYTVDRTEYGIDEFQVRGTKGEEATLISKDKKYKFLKNSPGAFPDDGKILTDGNTNTDDFKNADENKFDHIVSLFPDLAGQSFGLSEQIIDLEKVQNVSAIKVVIATGMYKGDGVPEYVTFFASEDGTKYEEIGKSYIKYIYGEDSEKNNLYYSYSYHTKKARYIKIQYKSDVEIAIDSVCVYGYEQDDVKKVSQPVVKSDANKRVAEEKALSSYNIASYGKFTVNNEPCDVLNDGKAGNSPKANNFYTVDTTNTSEILFSGEKIYQEICGIQVEILDEGIEPTIEVFVSENGKDYRDIGKVSYNVKAAGKIYYMAEFEKNKAQYVKLLIKGEGTVKIGEIAIFNSKVHSPTIKGGFVQITPSDSPLGYASWYSKSQWDRQFALLKRCQMEYVIVQYGALRDTMLSLYPSPSDASFAYKGDNTQDIIKDIMEAADKVGIKVYLGGVADLSFQGAMLNMSKKDSKEWTEKQIEYSKSVFNDLYKRYGSYKSFGGFYLADETCDNWMASQKGRGYKEARELYYGQSEIIRGISPDIKIMISPAIWRGTKPSVFAEDIVNMLKDGPMGKPVVDIVAAQDCLGREPMTNYIYSEYERRADAISEALRSIGIEFWNDTEIFREGGGTKNIDEIKESLIIENKNTSNSIVFDLLHYFDHQKGGFDNIRDFENDYVAREYIRYLDNYNKNIKITQKVSKKIDTEEKKSS